jgi:hypothetical protein
MKLLLIILFLNLVLTVLAQTAIYGFLTRDCKSNYFVVWTNVPMNFNLQMTEDLVTWTNLVMVRTNKAFNGFQHPLKDTNSIGYFRLLILP